MKFFLDKNTKIVYEKSKFLEASQIIHYFSLLEKLQINHEDETAKALIDMGIFFAIFPEHKPEAIWNQLLGLISSLETFISLEEIPQDKIKDTINMIDQLLQVLTFHFFSYCSRYKSSPSLILEKFYWQEIVDYSGTPWDNGYRKIAIWLDEKAVPAEGAVYLAFDQQKKSGIL